MFLIQHLVFDGSTGVNDDGNDEDEDEEDEEDEEDADGLFG